MKIISRKEFYKQLLFVIAIAVIFLISWNYFPQIHDFQLLGIQSLFVFIAFSIYVFEKGINMVHHADRNAFTRFIILTILIKMTLSVGVVFFYYKNYHPNSKFFLIPFFINYFLFTIFETRFSSKIGKMNPLDSSKHNNHD